MQNCLSLENPRFEFKSTSDFLGTHVPWEVAGYGEDFRNASKGGIFDLSHWDTVEISGKDTRDFLHRMSTVNTRKFDPRTISHGAFLTSRAAVISLGFLQAVGEVSYHFMVPPPQGSLTAEHLERFHFSETLEIRNRGEDWAMFGIWGGDSVLGDIGLRFAQAPLTLQSVLWKEFSLQAWRDDCRPELVWVKTDRAQGPAFLERLQTCGLPILGQRLFEYFRIRSAVPVVGIELSERDIILEGNFDRAVARNKGCYPGQEVIERIFTYGSVNRKLLPIEVEAVNGLPPAPLSIEKEGKEIGTLVSHAEQPDDPHVFHALVFLHKEHWDLKGARHFFTIDRVITKEIEKTTNQRVKR